MRGAGEDMGEVGEMQMGQSQRTVAFPQINQGRGRHVTKHNFFFFNVYSPFERQSMSRGGAKREGDRESEVKQAPGSDPSAQSPMRGSNLTNKEIMT